MSNRKVLLTRAQLRDAPPEACLHADQAGSQIPTMKPYSQASHDPAMLTALASGHARREWAMIRPIERSCHGFDPHMAALWSDRIS